MPKSKGKIGRPKGSSSQTVYASLRQRILSLEMGPGEDIEENALCKELGVSRTPVREALIRLATDGFVKLLPNRGASVSPLDVNEMPELLEALELSLRVTTRWAASRRTDADLEVIRDRKEAWERGVATEDVVGMSEANNSFHLMIAEASGNRYMTNLYQSLLPGFFRLSVSVLSSRIGGVDYNAYYARISAEHEQMYQAIVDQDTVTADKLASQHASHMKMKLIEYFQQTLSSDFQVRDPLPLQILAS